MDELDERGIATVRGVLDEARIAAFKAGLEPIQEGARRGGYRHLLTKSPLLADFVRSRPFRSLIGPRAFAVRAILFDKTPQANWKVIWHQDLTIAVAARAGVPGFGPWSEKEGVSHVQPPVEILQQMVAVRLHLDDCGPLDGPLRVIPGSHLQGRLSAEAIAAARAQAEEICAVRAGDALLMRPLLLHASSAAERPSRGRVIHVECAASELPAPLAWHTRV